MSQIPGKKLNKSAIFKKCTKSPCLLLILQCTLFTANGPEKTALSNYCKECTSSGLLKLWINPGRFTKSSQNKGQSSVVPDFQALQTESFIDSAIKIDFFFSTCAESVQLSLSSVKYHLKCT